MRLTTVIRLSVLLTLDRPLGDAMNVSKEMLNLPTLNSAADRLHKCEVEPRGGNTASNGSVPKDELVI